MFLHIVAVDKQLSVHADDKKPLKEAVDKAFKYHGKRRTPKHTATNAKTKKLSLSKSPKANGLKDQDMVYVS